ncbi:hypothetical protein BAE44_0023833 [Dichanthelium oligosanthes]|uniref:RNase H type-1 domain-containing protein n=1 Tax=Dichanthelium oligosanthes TaxID=888268 RepID=A0A1E5UQH9_9POAL|nr:hypothetical protein BAE44_0023833 [Dichanthelium oligosanthes]
MDCLKGVQRLTEWVKKPAVIESDCHNPMLALNSESDNRASFSNIVKEIKCNLSAILKVTVVCKVGRKCNRVAHELAQLAKRSLHSVVWRDQAPSCIHELLCYDCKQLSK